VPSNFSFSNNPNILRLKLIALGVFAAISVGLVAYQFLYVIPAEKCAKEGGWWLAEKRGCYSPIYLPAVTGRKPGEARQIAWPKVTDPKVTASAPQSSASASASVASASASSASSVVKP
jgi:hypothetical protein